MRSESEQLCTSCGFCCDGTLFTSVPLEPAEVASSIRVGLRVLTTSDGPRVSQPCAALSHRECRVYEQRPTTCRTYQCDLLVALHGGEVSVDEARAIVDRVRELALAPANTAKVRELLRHHFRGRRGQSSQG